jgi:hypothetical protein
VVPRCAGIERDFLYWILHVDPALFDIALDHDPLLFHIALWGIAWDQNGVALYQLIKLWSHAVWLKGTIYQKFVYRWLSWHNNYKIKFKNGAIYWKILVPRVSIWGLGVIDWRKNWGSNISWHCLFKQRNLITNM